MIQETSVAKKIIKNTKYNAIGRMWEILVRLFLTPYIISRIGGERYGIWAIVTVVTGYFSMIDLGVGDSYMKYFAEFFAKGDRRRVNELTNTGFVFYALIGLVILVIAFPLVHSILSFFNIENVLYSEALFALRLGFLIFAISSVFGVFSYIPLGLQRMDITNIISIVLSLPYIAGTIIFLELGFGLRGLMVNSAIHISFITISHIIVSYRLYPQISFNPFKYFSVSMMKKLICFGYKLKIMHIAILINRHLDKLLIGHFMTMGFVTFYHLGNTIVEKARNLPYILISALLPAFGELYYKKGKEQLIDGYLRGTKYLSFLVIPFFVFVFVSARNILLLWMGPGYSRSIFVLRVLIVGWMVYCLSWVTRPILKTVEKHKLQMITDIIVVILNLVCSLLLILKFGFHGVVYGTTISLITGGIFLIIQFHRILKISFLKVVKTILFITLSSVITGIIIAFVDHYLQFLIYNQGRLISFVVFVSEGFFFIIIYFLLLRIVKPFDDVDMKNIGKHIVFARPFLAYLTSGRKKEIYKV